MSIMDTKERSAPTVEQGQASMEYARDLFADYFETQGNNAFTTLGYTDQQKTEVKRALGTMAEVEGIYEHNPSRVRYNQLDEGLGIIYESQLSGLNNGGYKLFAGNLYQIGDKTNAAIKHIEETKTNLPKEHLLDTLGVIEMLGEDVDLRNADDLVKHLYNGAWANRFLRQNFVSDMNSMGLKGFLKNLASRSQANYKAGWIDDATNLELVVETDVYSKLLKLRHQYSAPRTGTVREVWRRLPEVEAVDGKIWTPFGKKPNPSQQEMQRVLENKTSKSFVGKTVQQH